MRVYQISLQSPKEPIVGLAGEDQHVIMYHKHMRYPGSDYCIVPVQRYMNKFFGTQFSDIEMLEQ
jgi:hypothetical protein